MDRRQEAEEWRLAALVSENPALNSKARRSVFFPQESRNVAGPPKKNVASSENDALETGHANPVKPHPLPLPKKKKASLKKPLKLGKTNPKWPSRQGKTRYASYFLVAGNRESIDWKMAGKKQNKRVKREEEFRRGKELLKTQKLGGEKRVKYSRAQRRKAKPKKTDPQRSQTHQKQIKTRSEN